MSKYSIEEEFDDTLYTNQIKVLSSKINHLLENSGRKVIGITSAVDSEGKTTLSYQISDIISRSGYKKILLIDGDMRKCGLTMKLGMNGDPGLSDYLNGRENRGGGKFDHPKKDNLYILATGITSAESPELLGGNTFKEMITEIRKEFDLVIIDLPPIVNTPDPLVVKDVIDGFVLVYYSGKTPRDLLEYAIEEVGKDNVLGVVLNRLKSDGFFKYQRYYKSYYKSYYNG